MERHNGIEPDPEGAFVYYADAQATVEALQRELLEWKRALCGLTPGGSEFADDHAYCAEWVRKARENQHDIIISKHRKLKATQAFLDAERERYELLNVERNAIDDKRHVLLEQLANTIEAAAQQEGELAEIQALASNLKSQLAQLKALVRALPVVRIEFDGAYHEALLAQPEDEAVKKLLKYRATLDVTMPAAKGGDSE